MKDYFKIAWEHEKSNSIKLSLFYNTIKQSFIKEEYLDLREREREREREERPSIF